MFGMGTGGTLTLRSPRSRKTFGTRPAAKESPDGCAELSMGNYLVAADRLGLAAVSHCIFTVNFMVKPNGLLVTVSSTYYYAYTSVLSTWSSTTALQSYYAWENSSRGRFRAYMRSALILTKLRYPAMPLA